MTEKSASSQSQLAIWKKTQRSAESMATPYGRPWSTFSQLQVSAALLIAKISLLCKVLVVRGFVLFEMFVRVKRSKVWSIARHIFAVA